VIRGVVRRGAVVKVDRGGGGFSSNKTRLINEEKGEESNI
jgi:hypothetical protein